MQMDRIIVFCILLLFFVYYIIVSIRRAKYGGKSDRLNPVLGSLNEPTKRGDNLKTPKSFNTKGFVCDILELLVPAAIAFIIVTKVIGISTIQSGSMEPTLNVGSTVFYNKLCYTLAGQEIRRGDIICFYDPTFDKYISKRVIGIPGDRLVFYQGNVYINGDLLDESDYVKYNKNANLYNAIIDVPPKSYFVLGDNRDNSYDSRYWDDPFIDKEQIEGRFMGQLDFSLQYDVFERIGISTN